MDRRRSPRVSTVLPVCIWGMDAHSLPFMELATVRNISLSGAVIHGVSHRLREGEIVEVQHDGEKAQFRIVWVGQAGTSEQGEIGVQALPAEPVIWDINLWQCCELVGQG
jgi:PilZ domain